MLCESQKFLHFPVIMGKYNRNFKNQDFCSSVCLYCHSSDQKQSDAKKLHSAFEEDDCWINSGDVLVMNDNYEVFFCDRLGDTFRK